MSESESRRGAMIRVKYFFSKLYYDSKGMAQQDMGLHEIEKKINQFLQQNPDAVLKDIKLQAVTGIPNEATLVALAILEKSE